MQVTFFRSEYLTQEEALRHHNGVCVICYIIRYAVEPDARLAWILEGFPKVIEAQKSSKVGPLPLSKLFPMFYEDYFLYWGALDTVKGDRYAVRWLVPRTTLFASEEQLGMFRKLWDPWDSPNPRNFRSLQETGDRIVFFISPHWNQYNSLLPMPRVPEPSISVFSQAYMKNRWMFPMQNSDMWPTLEYDPKEAVKLKWAKRYEDDEKALAEAEEKAAALRNNAYSSYYTY